MAGISIQMKKRIEALEKNLINRQEPLFIVCRDFRQTPLIGYTMTHKAKGRVLLEKTDTETEEQFTARAYKEAVKGGFGYTANGRRHITFGEERSREAKDYEASTVDRTMDIDGPIVNVTSYAEPIPVDPVDLSNLEGQEPVYVGSVQPPPPKPEPLVKPKGSPIQIMKQQTADLPDWQMM